MVLLLWQRLKLVIAVLGAVLINQIAFAYSSGPPNAVTGAPGESTCGIASCHGNLNTGSGSVSLDAPLEYRPGDTIDLSVVVAMIDQQRWGFEATVLDTLDQPVGEIILTDPSRTQLGSALGRQYVKHTLAGTDNNTPDQSPGWSFQWIAPETDAGSVVFYVAGNAANGNNTNSGDFIYTHSVTVDQDLSTGIADGDSGTLPVRAELYQNVPNPFNPNTTISFSLSRASFVQLTIYNVTGRKVRTLLSRDQRAGTHTLDWDGRDRNGTSVASGVYFYRLVADGVVQTRKMMLLR